MVTAVTIYVYGVQSLNLQAKYFLSLSEKKPVYFYFAMFSFQYFRTFGLLPFIVSQKSVFASRGHSI